MSTSVVSSLCVVMAVSVGSFLGGLARPCLLRRRLWMEALGKHLLACRAVPLLVLVACDLAFDKQLCELSALRLALEGHQTEASKRQAWFGLGRPDASRTSWSVEPAVSHTQLHLDAGMVTITLPFLWPWSTYLCASTISSSG